MCGMLTAMVCFGVTGSTAGIDLLTCKLHDMFWELTVWRAAALQLAQVRVLLEAAAAMADAPTLVAGDFNSAPASGVHRFCSR